MLGRVDGGTWAPYAGRMRWDALFNDIESQLADSDALSLEAEINERARAEMVHLGLPDRLRGAVGLEITAHLHCGETVHGTLTHAGADALVLDAGRNQLLVPYWAAARYVGLGRLSVAEPSTVRRAIGLAHALRGLARDRAELSVTVGNSSGSARLAGVIDRVGKDYIDLASVVPGEARRNHQVSQVSTVPFASLAIIRSQGRSL